MNRTRYFNYIEEKLGVLAYRINLKGRLNILDMHLHSENFYLDLLNNLYGWDLTNANPIMQNIEAIDLIDHTNKCICQVSATNTKQKVESALEKGIIENYTHYTFKFVCISKEGTKLRKIIFKNPYGISFNSNADIIDNKSILDRLLELSIDKQLEIFKFIQKELGNDFDIVKLDSNLAIVINTLSKENLHSPLKHTINSFEIERKIKHNKLQKTHSLIVDNGVYLQRVNHQYTTLDALGINKSLSVLQSINKSYLEEASTSNALGQDELFLKVIKNVTNKVLLSANYSTIPIDELDFCVTVLVVDAFIRCKIFENPTNYKYVTA
jgi:hypothetical protein